MSGNITDSMSTWLPKLDRLRALRASGLLHHRSGGAFDDEITLVRQALGVPVAIVSLVDEDRQVFAGQQGLPEPWATMGETPLTHSFCQHVAASGEPFVVPDAYDEPLVEGNLAITDLSVRSYLGVPLTLPTGEVVGALAAIGSAPRAWSEKDVAILTTFAKVVSKNIKTEIEERKWRGLFAEMQEGFILGSLIRGPDGRVVDWRYDEVNRAWGELVGIPSARAAGRTIRELFPGIEDEWVDEFAQVVETQQSISFTRQVGNIQRWYDGFVQPAGEESFVALFIETTERELANTRRDALVELGDRLKDMTDVEAMTMAASETLGITLDAMLVGYGEVEPEDETITVERDWTARGARSLAGTRNFREYGSYIEDFKRGETVVVMDCRTDPRTRDNAEALERYSARAFVNTPVYERGRFVALLYVSTAEAREWTEADLAFIRDVASRLRAGIARARAEADQAVLNQELGHRMKNTLALVQAIATQTLRGVSDKEPVRALERRLHALSSAHDILLNREVGDSTLAEVIQGALAGLGQADRVRVDGPAVHLGSRSALSLALLVHELTTNALKHGALSQADGHVTVDWELDGEALTFRWREHGGPPAMEPTRKVLGSRLISGGLTGTGDTELDYGSDGFSATMRATVEQLRT